MFQRGQTTLTRDFTTLLIKIYTRHNPNNPDLDYLLDSLPTKLLNDVSRTGIRQNRVFSEVTHVLKGLGAFIPEILDHISKCVTMVTSTL